MSTIWAFNILSPIYLLQTNQVTFVNFENFQILRILRFKCKNLIVKSPRQRKARASVPKRQFKIEYMVTSFDLRYMSPHIFFPQLERTPSFLSSLVIVVYAFFYFLTSLHSEISKYFRSVQFYFSAWTHKIYHPVNKVFLIKL